MKKLLAVLIALTLAAPAFATPIITGSTGTAANGATFRFTGTGYGVKASGIQTPLAWADFEDGTGQPVAALSSKDSWTVQKMAVATDNYVSGTHALKSASDWNVLASNGGGQICGVKTIISGAVRGGKYYFAQWKRVTYTWKAGENWKWWRFWTPADGDNYPNIYLGSQPHDSTCKGGGARKHYVEACPSSQNIFVNGYTAPSSTWRLEEIFLKINSGSGLADGVMTIKLNGVTVATKTDFKSDCSGFSGANFQDAWFEDNYSNYDICPSLNPTGTRPTGDVWRDDLYIENGWQRVYLTNAPTFAGSTKFFLQPHSAWSTVGVTVKLNYGNLTGNVYGYVCDDNDVCNTDGWLVASGVIGDPPPGDPCENVTCAGNEFCQEGVCIANPSTNVPTADPDMRVQGFGCDCKIVTAPQ